MSLLVALVAIAATVNVAEVCVVRSVAVTA